MAGSIPADSVPADSVPGGPVPAGDGDLAGDVADLLDAVARRLRRAARGELASVDVTWAQVRALRAVVRLGGRPRMSEIADALGVARRSATSLVDELEARRLVRRHRDATDRRAVTVAVTAQGEALLRRLRARRQAAARRMLAELDRGEMETLHALLGRLRRAATIATSTT